MNSLRVLLTGATGYIAGQLLPAFRESYDLRAIDVRERNASGEKVGGVEVADLLSADESDLSPLFADVDALVHCGHVKPEGEDPRSQYEGERRNLDMMQRVYQLSLEHGVRRVVAASTNQAAKWYENPYYAGLKDRVDPEDYPAPRLLLRLGQGCLGAARVPLRLRQPGEEARGSPDPDSRPARDRRLPLRRRAAGALRPGARRLHKRTGHATAFL